MASVNVLPTFQFITLMAECFNTCALCSSSLHSIANRLPPF